jgi:hypothetical protein
MMNMKTYLRVRCAVCNNYYIGIVPKGGDGSVLLPRKHYKSHWQPYTTFSGVHHEWIPTVDCCPGSYKTVDVIEKGGEHGKD